MADKIDELRSLLEDARALLDDIRRGQTDDSDVGNDDHITEAYASLDTFEGHVGDLVP